MNKRKRERRTRISSSWSSSSGVASIERKGWRGFGKIEERREKREREQLSKRTTPCYMSHGNKIKLVGLIKKLLHDRIWIVHLHHIIYTTIVYRLFDWAKGFSSLPANITTLLLNGCYTFIPLA